LTGHILPKRRQPKTTGAPEPTVVEQQRHPVVDAVAGAFSRHFLLLFHEAGEAGLLDLDGLADPIVEVHREVEEVGLAQVVGRRMLEMGSSQLGTENA
jgi:hypothetical protein